MNFLKYSLIACLLCISNLLIAQQETLADLARQMQDTTLTVAELKEIGEKINKITEGAVEEQSVISKAGFLDAAEEIIEEADSEKQEIIAELISIAQNPEVVKKDRLKAFDILGNSNDPKAIRFLIEKVDVQYFVDHENLSTGDGELNMYGAFIAIYPADSERAWKLIPYVMKSVNVERSEMALQFYTEIILQAFDELTITEDLVKIQIEEGGGAKRKANLNAMLKILEAM